MSLAVQSAPTIPLLSRLPGFESFSRITFTPPKYTADMGVWNQMRAWWAYPKTRYCEQMAALVGESNLTREQESQVVLAVLFLVRNQKHLYGKLGYDVRSIFSGLPSKKKKELIGKATRKFLKESVDQIIEKFRRRYQGERLAAAVVKTIKGCDLSPMSYVCSALLSLTEMQEIIGETSQEASEALLETFSSVPKRKKQSIGRRIAKDMQASSTVIKNFFPNLLNTFLTAFAVFDAHKRIQSTWEANAMLEIYWKILMIPLALVGLLSHLLLDGWKLYAAVSGIISFGLIALYAYLNWLKPIPSKIPAATNYTMEYVLGNLPKVQGRHEIFSDLVNALRQGCHVMLHGPSGVGKSELINGLPERYQDKTIFKIDSASLVQGGYVGVVEKLQQSLLPLQGVQNQVVVVFDEAHVFAENESLINHLKDQLMNRSSGWQFVFVTDRKEKAFKDNSFTRRCSLIKVDPMEKSEVFRVLKNRLNEEVYLREKGALKHLYDKSMELKKNYEQPAAGTHLLDAVLTELKKRSDPNKVSKKHAADLRERESLLAGVQLDGQLKKKDRDLLIGLKTKLTSHQEHHEGRRARICRVASLLQTRLLLNDWQGKLARNGMRLEMGSEERKEYLRRLHAAHDLVFPELLEELREAEGNHREKLRITSILVDQVVTKMKNNEGLPARRLRRRSL